MNGIQYLSRGRVPAANPAAPTHVELYGGPGDGYIERRDKLPVRLRVPRDLIPSTLTTRMPNTVYRRCRKVKANRWSLEVTKDGPELAQYPVNVMLYCYEPEDERQARAIERAARAR